MGIPRDITCWYCERGQHAKCPLKRTCACRTCYPRVNPITAALRPH